MKKRSLLVVLVSAAVTASIMLLTVGSAIGGTGARTGGSIVQNIDPDGSTNAKVLLTYYNQQATPVATQEAELGQYAALGFNAGSVSALSSGFIGSVVISSDKKIGAVANDTDDNSVGMYNGFTDGATTFYLPAIYEQAGGWTTEIWLQATESVPTGAQAQLTFMDRQGNQTGAVLNVDIATYATTRVVPSDNTAVTAGWAGGIVVNSTYKVAAIARVANASITEMYNGFASGDTTIYAPALYKNAGGWYSGIMVQNVGSANTDVSVNFYDRDGNASGSYSFPSSFVPNGVMAINTRNVAALADGWAGTAVVQSTGSVPIIAVMDVTNQASGLGNIYNGALASDASLEAYVPAQYKNAGGWTSGVIAMNIAAAATDVTFSYYDRTTQALTTSTQKTALGQYIAYAMNTINVSGAADGWAGAVQVTSTTGNVVVVANVTGYATGKTAMYSAFPKK